MKIAICPGSFDPVTKGHVDIISRAAKMFDRVIVLVVTNPAKSVSFSHNERVSLLTRAVAHIENAQVDTFGGLLADYAREKGATAIVKGLRAVSDFEYEFQMALTNKKLNPDVETVFLTATSDNMYLSSSIVKQIASFGGDISDFVPACILEEVRARLWRPGMRDA